MNHIDSANYNSQNLEIGVLYVILQKYVYTCKSFEQSIKHNVFFLIEIWYTCVSSASSKPYPISYMTSAFYSLEVGTAEWQMSLYVHV